MSDKISIDSTGKLLVPDQVTIPFIIGDGIGPDLSPEEYLHQI